MSLKAPELAALEGWMLEVMRHPDGVDGEADCAAARPAGATCIADIIEPSAALSSEDRLAIYANMYYWRLVDVLRSDYDVLSHTIGGDAFETLGRRFLQAQPSRSYSLTPLGAGLAEFIASEPGELPNPAFLAELAQLEWAIAMVFGERRDEPLSTEQLLAIPQEDFAGARFHTVRALRLLAFEHPVNRYFQGVRNEAEPEVPGPGKSWVAVVRRDLIVWRYDLEEAQFVLLSALQEGKALGEALMACAELPDADIPRLIERLRGWFQEWTADGFFTRIET